MKLINEILPTQCSSIRFRAFAKQASSSDVLVVLYCFVFSWTKWMFEKRYKFTKSQNGKNIRVWSSTYTRYITLYGYLWKESFSLFSSAVLFESFAVQWKEFMAIQIAEFSDDIIREALRFKPLLNIRRRWCWLNENFRRFMDVPVVVFFTIQF